MIHIIAPLIRRFFVACKSIYLFPVCLTAILLRTSQYYILLISDIAQNNVSIFYESDNFISLNLLDFKTLKC